MTLPLGPHNKRKIKPTEVKLEVIIKCNFQFIIGKAFRRRRKNKSQSLLINYGGASFVLITCQVLCCPLHILSHSA